MNIWLTQLLTGVLTGSLYGAVALALVMTYRASRLVNFGQGEMAMFSTFVAYSLSTAGIPYWAVFILAMIIAFALAAAVHITLVAPSQRSTNAVAPVLVTIGLFLAFNSLAQAIWGGTGRSFPQPFSGPPLTLWGAPLARHSVYAFCVTLGLMVLLHTLVNRTWTGLAIRAMSEDPSAARLMGVSTRRMEAISWGMSGSVGVVAGMLLAPTVGLQTSFMFPVLIYAFGSAVLGGFDSPVGVVVGGVVVAVLQNLIGTYLQNVLGFFSSAVHVENSNQYRDILVLIVIVAVLSIRPVGLFGKRRVEKV
jgi:branched-chain amino acid transport system permease protein